MALLVNARTAAAAPGKQVSRTGEGSPREEEDRAGNGVSQLGGGEDTVTQKVFRFHAE